jgi:polysaccharide deacetylase 2 family uncharacterized protein YibQ
MATQGTRRKRPAGKKPGARLSAALIVACLVGALAVGAGLGWWGAARMAPHPAPPGPAAAMPVPPATLPVRPAAPVPAPAEPEPEPEVASLPPAAEVRPTVQTWRTQALSFTPVPGKPMIAIVIDDMGVDPRRSARVIGLPAPLTTSFLTYAQNLPKQAKASHAAGHELLLHMPMEPSGAGYDPGPDVLLAAMGEEAIRARLRKSLAAFSGYVGINNHMGSKFTADEAAMRVVMRELHADGLLFLDSLTSGKSVGAKVALAEGVPNLSRDVFLDDDPQPAAIREQLRRVEAHARKTGAAIAIGHPRDTTIEALKSWLPQAKAEGFQLVPLSALAKAKYGE